MSNAIFPTLPGMSWNVVKQPEFSTIIHRAISGKEIRGCFWSYPLWTFKLSFEVIRNDATNELKTLMGFFLQRQGSYDTFLFEDPDDKAVTGQTIGMGNGTTTMFQLVRTFGGFTEPIFNLNGSPSIYLNGVLQTSGYSVGSTGIVTFATAPGNGVAVTASFNYYFRVRFTHDLAEFSKFMKDLWELKKCEFVSVK